MRLTCLAAGLITALLTSTAEAETKAFLPKERATASAEAVRVRKTLDDQLLDYPAARFRNVRAAYLESGGPDTVRLCGEINPRNRAGGYNGWQPFAATSDPEIFKIGDEVFYPALCESDGLVFDTRDYSSDLTHR